MTRAQTQLADYHDRHAGDTIVVCGCGPSLLDLREPERLVTIGVNDVGRLFEPTYLVVVNPPQQFKGDRFVHVQRAKVDGLFTQLDLGPVASPVVRFKLGRFGGTDDGAGRVLHYTQNSPYVAVCLAAWMGATRIGLIGVDFNDHHFFATTGRHPLASRLREIDGQYARLAEALAARGVELVNLSRTSRLTSLPRASIDGTPLPRPAIPEAPTMKLMIEQRGGSGMVGALLDRLAATAQGLGHRVTRTHAVAMAERGALAIVWNGRHLRSRGPVLYCEHGWLPRSDYQISARGINAGSHAAPFAWDGRKLAATDDAALQSRLDAIKSASYSGPYRSMQPGLTPADGLPERFLLVPLQIESDTNIVRHAPAALRTMQALADHVARLDPPWPVIFKQHPADARHGNRHLALRLRRRQDQLWPQSRGNVHQMLASGRCTGVLTLNSNVAHDALLWDLPAIVLGRNVWPSAGEVTPFLTAVPKRWGGLAEHLADPQVRDCRRAYAWHLMRHQWSLADAGDPSKVTALLAGAARAHADAGAARADADSRPLRTPPIVARARPAPSGPTINVVAENRGWLFDAWKRQLAASRWPGFTVTATAQPIGRADAWIFVRAREASRSPDPSRTVVQVHDLLDRGRYRPGGEREAVRRCAAVALTHPAQRQLLAAAGMPLEDRRWILRPPGWSGQPPPRRVAPRPTVAWVGRPSPHDGVEHSGLADFVDAAASLRGRARVALIGERLDAALLALRRAGVDAQRHPLDQHPIVGASAWIGGFDLLVVSGAADAGPWPIFDALHAGVPVLACRVGWAETLLADGRAGRLVERPEELGAAMLAMLAEREDRAARRAEIAARVQDFSLAAWAQANLELAAALVGAPALRAAA